MDASSPWGITQSMSSSAYVTARSPAGPSFSFSCARPNIAMNGRSAVQEVITNVGWALPECQSPIEQSIGGSIQLGMSIDQSWPDMFPFVGGDMNDLVLTTSEDMRELTTHDSRMANKLSHQAEVSADQHSDVQLYGCNQQTERYTEHMPGHGIDLRRNESMIFDDLFDSEDLGVVTQQEADHFKVVGSRTESNTWLDWASISC